MLTNDENYVSPNIEDIVSQSIEDSEEPLPANSASIDNNSSPTLILSEKLIKKRKCDYNLATTNYNSHHQPLVRLIKEEKEDDESILFGKWLGIRLSKIKSKKARISVQKQICALVESVISSDED